MTENDLLLEKIQFVLMKIHEEGEVVLKVLQQ